MLLECKKVSKFYTEGENQTQVLKEVSFSMQQGELAAIVGSSGSGKSTLLHTLGLRNRHLGFVYQFHHLMADFNALENVMMPMLIGRQNKTEAKDRAEAMLQAVGLSHRLKHRPSALSGGERQRVAIARALVNRPDLVLADEPTGNLDHKTTESIFELIQKLNQEQNIAFLLVTHDMYFAQKLSRCLTMQDGILQEGA